MKVRCLGAHVLYVDTFIVVVVVNHLFVHHQVGKPLGLLLHGERHHPRQRLPEHHGDEDEGVAANRHETSIGKRPPLTQPFTRRGDSPQQLFNTYSTYQ